MFGKTNIKIIAEDVPWSGSFTRATAVKYYSGSPSNKGSKIDSGGYLINGDGNANKIVFWLPIPKGATRLYLRSTYYLNHGSGNNYAGYCDNLDQQPFTNVFDVGSGYKANYTINIETYHKYYVFPAYDSGASQTYTFSFS